MLGPTNRIKVLFLNHKKCRGIYSLRKPSPGDGREEGDKFVNSAHGSADLKKNKCTLVIFSDRGQKCFGQIGVF